MRIITYLITLYFFISINFAQTNTDGNSTKQPIVTFIELGSVNCIPCKKMQPVMKAIENKYRDQIKVVFHDVWTEKGKPFSQKYKIKLIPTQIFIDKNGKEFFRHEGFFSEKDIDNLLQKQGLKPISTKL